MGLVQNLVCVLILCCTISQANVTNLSYAYKCSEGISCLITQGVLNYHEGGISIYVELLYQSTKAQDVKSHW